MTKALVLVSFDVFRLNEITRLQSFADISHFRGISIRSPTYSTAERLKNIVKAALKYYTVSHRKNCCAVDNNLPLSPRTSDDSYCSHEENTSAVTLNSRAGEIPSRDIAATLYSRCISKHCINQLC